MSIDTLYVLRDESHDPTEHILRFMDENVLHINKVCNRKIRVFGLEPENLLEGSLQTALKQKNIFNLPALYISSEDRIVEGVKLIASYYYNLLSAPSVKSPQPVIDDYEGYYKNDMYDTKDAGTNESNVATSGIGAGGGDDEDFSAALSRQTAARQNRGTRGLPPPNMDASPEPTNNPLDDFSNITIPKGEGPSNTLDKNRPPPNAGKGDADLDAQLMEKIGGANLL